MPEARGPQHGGRPEDSGFEAVVRRFEAACRAGQRPRIEDYLGDLDEPARSELRAELQAVEAEMGLRRTRRVTRERFLEWLVESGLMTEEQFRGWEQSLPPERRPEDGEQLARELVAAGRLTPYQARAVFHGKVRGLVFGEYVVLDRLGAGGMGVVLKAEHRRMARLAAVKVLPASSIRSPDAVRRFYREVRAAARLFHPNIATAYDAGESNGMHYLAMEYVEGKDLSRILKEHGPLPVDQAVACVIQAARGLQYAHEQGVVHRDIKPGNLVLSDDGVIKILDMGLARIGPAGGVTQPPGGETLTTSGQVMGTCDYMAPEQAEDIRRADHRVDIYALGCTLYRLLTGKPVYEGETFLQVLLAHREAPIPSLRDALPEAPIGLDRVFQKMVAKRPEERYASMAEVIADLEACLEAGERQGTAARQASAASEMLSSLSLASNKLRQLLDRLPRSALTRRAASEQRETVAGRAEDETSRERLAEAGSDQAAQRLPAPSRRVRWAGAAAAVAAVAVLAGLGFWFGRPRFEQPGRTPVAASSSGGPASASPPGAAGRGPQEPAEDGRTGEAGDQVQAEQQAGPAGVPPDEPSAEQASPVGGEPEDVPAEPSPATPPSDGSADEAATTAAGGTGTVPIELAGSSSDDASPPSPGGQTEAASVSEAAEQVARELEQGPLGGEAAGDQAERDALFDPVRQLAAAWDVQGALAELARVPLPEGDAPAAAQAEQWRERLQRLVVLKGRIIDVINRSPTPLTKQQLRLSGIGGRIVRADDRVLLAETITGKQETHDWSEVGAVGAAELLRRAVDPNDGVQCVDAGVLAMLLDDASLAQRYFAAAAKAGVDADAMLDSLAGRMLRTAEELAAADQLEQARRLLRDLKDDFGDTPWYAGHEQQVDQLLQQVEDRAAGNDEMRAEQLFRQAAQLYREKRFQDLKPLVELLRKRYSDTKPVNQSWRIPSFREMELAVKSLAAPLIVRRDGSGRFRSIQQAIAAAPPNGVIEIRDNGPYGEHLVIPADKAGLVIRGAEGCWPIVTPAAPKENRNVVHVQAPQATLERLVLVNVPRAGATGLYSEGVGLRVRSCLIASTKPGSQNWRLAAMGRVENSLLLGGGVVDRRSALLENCVWISPSPLDRNVPARLRHCTVLGQVNVDVSPSFTYTDSIIGYLNLRGAMTAGDVLANCLLIGSDPPQGAQACRRADPRFRDRRSLDLRVAPDSPCHAAASDGGDIGVRYTPELAQLCRIALALRARRVIDFQ